MSKLIPDELQAQMIKNHYDVTKRDIGDHAPVVKLYMPSFPEGNRPVWLLSEIDASYTDIAFGLCDMGAGSPELGNLSLHELKTVNHPQTGLPLVERDETFIPSYPMSVYYKAARMCQRITDNPDQLAAAKAELKSVPE